MAWTINRLCPALGTELIGFDAARPMTDAEFAELRQCWLANDGVLVLRDQHLTPEQHIEFSRRFGELFGDREPLQDTVTKYLLPGHPQIFRVSNKVVGGEPQGRQRAGNYWHSDVSFRARPAMASLLYGIEIPPLGGDTLFCNMFLAYEALSESLQGFLGGLRARHDFAVNTTQGFANEVIQRQDLDGRNASEHPVVRIHAETGRKCLFVNPGNTSHIVGLKPKESALLLNFLYQHCVQPEFIYRHRWKPRDLLIWDNRSTMHYAIVDYQDDRYLHRTTVIGERPM
ncbi:MAG: TauD/TfdA family dioxygenase [Gammaproteobacteria bacterium]